MDMKDVSHEDIEDLPMDEVIKKAQEIIEEGGIVLFKFTCEYCGSRQTGTTPNTFHSVGYYCNECKELCMPKKYGIMAIFAKGLSREKLLNMIKIIVTSKVKQ